MLVALTTDGAAQTVLGRVAQPRLVVIPAKGTLSSGELIKVRFKLLDRYNNPYPADADLNLTLTMTVLESLETVKKKLVESRLAPTQLPSPLSNQILLLPPDKESVQATCLFPRGATELTLRFRSNRTGRIRIFAEASNFTPGSAIVSVIRMGANNRPSESSRSVVSLEPVVWQETPSIASTSPNNPTEYYLEIVPDGVTEYADLGSGTLIDHFYIGLNNQDRQPIRATQPIDVLLTVNRISASAAFTSRSVRIEKGEAQTLQPVQLRSYSPGQVKLVAQAISSPEFRVRPYELPWNIEPLFQATGLALNWDRRSALASGLDGIKITVKPVQMMPNGKERFIRPEEEGLTKRVVHFAIDQGFGFQFEGGKQIVEIEKDKDYGEIVIYGKRPTNSLKIIARSSGFSSQAEGETNVSFYWPWLYLLWAALGGLGYRLLTGFKEKVYLIWGTVIGMIFFCLACWAAITLGKVNLGGWDLELAKIPIENPFAPPIMGFIFSWLIQEKQLSRLKEAMIGNRQD